MDIDGFWLLLERSARETTGPRQRIRWLEHQLSHVARTDIVDFQVHLDTARRPIDTYAMWGAASLIMDGLCSDDGFWYFQPWLIGRGQHWYQLAAHNPDNLADVPAVRTLAGRRPSQWADAEWPQWEELDYVASSVHDQVTGQEDSINDALAARRHLGRSSPAPTDPAWDFDNLTESSNACHDSPVCSHASDTSRLEQLTHQEQRFIKQVQASADPEPFDICNREPPRT